MTSTDRGLQIPSLDGLRCLAILPVFVSHALEAAGLPRVVPGNFGVTLFFFLSGYLITTLMRLEFERTGSLSFRMFYLRRALRIMPTCYIVLALAAVYGWLTGRVEPWWLVGQALHLTNYQIIVGGWEAPIAPHTDVYWSLAVEEHFYLVFPVVYLLLARTWPRVRIAALLLGACVVVFLWRCLLIFGLDASFDRTYLSTDTRIDSILFGCVLALWGNPAMDRSAISSTAWQRRWLPLAVVVILVTFLVPHRAFRETFGYTVQGLCLFAVFITAVRYPDWGPMRLLNLRPVKWIGLLSYAIYLVHPSMLALAKSLTGPAVLPMMVVATGLTGAAAALLYYGVERPLGRVRKRYSIVDRHA